MTASQRISALGLLVPPLGSRAFSCVSAFHAAARTIFLRGERASWNTAQGVHTCRLSGRCGRFGDSPNRRGARRWRFCLCRHDPTPAVIGILGRRYRLGSSAPRLARTLLRSPFHRVRPCTPSGDVISSGPAINTVTFPGPVVVRAAGSVRVSPPSARRSLRHSET